MTLGIRRTSPVRLARRPVFVSARGRLAQAAGGKDGPLRAAVPLDDPSPRNLHGILESSRPSRFPSLPFPRWMGAYGEISSVLQG